jgi:hypothetical protein
MKCAVVQTAKYIAVSFLKLHLQGSLQISCLGPFYLPKTFSHTENEVVVRLDVVDEPCNYAVLRGDFCLGRTVE